MSDATPATLEAVIAVARDAGALQLARRGERLAEVEKDGGGSFATAVDYACETLILDALRPRFPHHRFIAEESGVTGPDDVRRLLLPVVDSVRFAYVFGGAAANLAFVAEGSLDGYAHTASIWDYAAGALLVEEAGGRVSNFAGGTMSWSASRLDLVATNGRLHEALVSRLAQTPGGST